MSYCLHPNCQKPQNPEQTKFCISCGSKLLLKERYRAIKVIGQGGFGKTFLAVDEDKPSKPPCVIKQFFPQVQGTNNAQKAAELFEQEAVRLDDLGKHPQIPELLAHFQQDNQQYLVQEFIDGQNLAQVLEAEGTFKETQIIELLNSLLPVLQFIHNHHVIHRDIKPENIIRRRDGQLVLVDFGAAKYATGTALLKTGTTIGTPEYIAPEQARGKAVFASDLYSLGLVCIHLLTQVSPFELFDVSEDAWVWRQYLVNNLVSDKLGHILDKFIENATKRRYQSADEILRDLDQPSQSYPQSTPLSSQFAQLDIELELKTMKTQLTGNQPLGNKTKANLNNAWRCIQTLTEHDNSVLVVSFSPNGKMIASGSWDQTIKLWQLVTVENERDFWLPLRTLTGHSDWVRAIAISPNGQIIASGGEDRTIKLWQLSTGKLLHNLGEHSKYIRCLAFSSDGTIIASGSDDKTIKGWDIETKKQIGILRGHNNAVTSVAFSPDGNILASGSWDNSIKFWNLKNGNLVNTINGHTSAVSSIAFHPQGNILASGSWDCTIKLWQWNTDELLHTFWGHSGYVCAIAISYNGNILVSGSVDSTIKLWDINKKELLHTLKGHSGQVNSVAISPDGRTIVSGSDDKTIKIWRCD